MDDNTIELRHVKRSSSSAPLHHALPLMLALSVNDTLARGLCLSTKVDNPFVEFVEKVYSFFTY